MDYDKDLSSLDNEESKYLYGEIIPVYAELFQTVDETITFNEISQELSSRSQQQITDELYLLEKNHILERKSRGKMLPGYQVQNKDLLENSYA